MNESATTPMRQVFRISPDPQGAFDFLIVGTAQSAGQLAAEGAEASFDAGDDPPQAFAISCEMMSVEEFENLPEP